MTDKDPKKNRKKTVRKIATKPSSAQKKAPVKKTATSTKPKPKKITPNKTVKKTPSRVKVASKNPAPAQPKKNTKPAQKPLIPPKWHVRRRVFIGIALLLILLGMLYEMVDIWLDDNRVTPDETQLINRQQDNDMSLQGESATEEIDDDEDQNIFEEPLPPETTEIETPTEPVKELIEQVPPQKNIAHTPSRKIYAWEKNAISHVTTNKSYLVIVIDDLGLHSGRLQSLMALKLPLTLSFLPYAKQSPQLVEKARKKGFEIMIHVPMQPKDSKIDSGPNSLKVSMSSSEIQHTLEKNLNAFSGAIGINNHMGSAFTESTAKMQPVITEMKSREMIFLDSQTSPRTQGYKLAKQAGVHTLMRDVFIDNRKDVEHIKRKLNQADAIARKRGHAVAIGHPYRETIEAIKQWAADRKQDVAIVPSSMLVKKLYKIS